MLMRVVNIADLKNNLSAYLERVRRGGNCSSKTATVPSPASCFSLRVKT